MAYSPLTTGRATLVGGEVIVADPKVTATSVVLATNLSTGGTIGVLSVRITAGSSFTINSANILDTSTVGYQVIY